MPEGGRRTSPFRTTKKLVELQVATKPLGSSISASSAPAWFAWPWEEKGEKAGQHGNPSGTWR